MPKSKIQQNATEQRFVYIPKVAILDRFKWDKGDTLIWDISEDGTITLRKE